MKKLCTSGRESIKALLLIGLIVDEAILAHSLKTKAIAEAKIIPRAHTLLKSEI